MVHVPTTTPDELKQLIDSDEPATIVDVRGPGDFEDWHIDGGDNVEAVNVPFVEFQRNSIAELFKDINTDGEVVAVCASGATSGQVTSVLNREGIDAKNLKHGMNGWAFLYEGTKLDVESDAKIVQFQRPSSGCLSYMIIANDEAAVVDPLAAFADTYVQTARNFDAALVYALDTHVHADHVSGVRKVALQAQADVVVPEAAADRGIQFDEDYETVADGDTLSVGGVDIQVRHTPGHTSGMTAYLVDDEVLLTGDGLFTESVARPDLEDADAAADAASTLYASLQEQVLALPDDTVVAPAHFSDNADPAADGTYSARLGDLVDAMDALSMPEAEFVEYVLADMPPRPSNYEDIIETNLGQQNPPENVAFQLELGPNNCATTQDSMAD